MKLVVTGTGRSGTMFMSRLFSSLGVPCGHEEVFTIDGFNTWNWGRLQGDSSFCALPHIHSLNRLDTAILHVVRDPLDLWCSQLSSHCVVIDGEPTGGFWWRDLDDPEVGPWLRFLHSHVNFGELHDPCSKSIHFLWYWTMKLDYSLRHFQHGGGYIDTLRLEDVTPGVVSVLNHMGARVSENEVEDAVSSLGLSVNAREVWFGAEDLDLEEPKYLMLREFYDSL